MLVRSNGGRWCPAEQVDTLSGDAIAGLLEGDLGALLELDGSRHVIAHSPPVLGDRGPDAICVGGQGELGIVVAASGESAEQVVMRLAASAGTIAGWSIGELLEHCDQPMLGAEVEAGLEANLVTGSFELLVLADSVDGELAAALRWLTRGPATVRCFAFELHRSATMEALQPRELALDAAPASEGADAARREPRRAPHHEPPLYEVIGGPGFDDWTDVTPEAGQPPTLEPTPPESEPEPDLVPDAEQAEAADAPAVLMPAGPAWSPHGRIA